MTQVYHPTIGFATNALKMLTAQMVYVRAVMVGMAMGTNVNTNAQRTQCGRTIDAYKQAMKMNVSVAHSKKKKTFWKSWIKIPIKMCYFWWIDEIAPLCHSRGCTCATGYEMIETVRSKICRLIERDEDDEKCMKFLWQRVNYTQHYIFIPFVVPCDVETNCHQNASCTWVPHQTRNLCVCNPGFEGNGYECIEISKDVSCLIVSSPK